MSLDVLRGAQQVWSSGDEEKDEVRALLRSCAVSTRRLPEHTNVRAQPFPEETSQRATLNALLFLDAENKQLRNRVREQEAQLAASRAAAATGAAALARGTHLRTSWLNSCCVKARAANATPVRSAQLLSCCSHNSWTLGECGACSRPGASSGRAAVTARVRWRRCTDTQCSARCSHGGAPECCSPPFSSTPLCACAR